MLSKQNSSISLVRCAYTGIASIMSNTGDSLFSVVDCLTSYFEVNLTLAQKCTATSKTNRVDGVSHVSLLLVHALVFMSISDDAQKQIV